MLKKLFADTVFQGCALIVSFALLAWVAMFYLPD